jgi:hypothetical protein
MFYLVSFHFSGWRGSFLEAIPMNSPRSVEENANSAIGSSERLPRAILAVGLIVIWGGIAWLVFHLILGTA